MPGAAAQQSEMSAAGPPGGLVEQRTHSGIRNPSFGARQRVRREPDIFQQRIGIRPKLANEGRHGRKPAHPLRPATNLGGMRLPILSGNT